MIISYKWLQEYFEDKLPNPNDLADLITLKSLEVEGVDGDVIDIDVLPNRAHDCLCHDGIAREVSAITGLKLKEKKDVEVKVDFDTNFKVDVSSDICRRYMAREIQNVKVGKSPKELVEKIEAMGGKSINNVVDILNIVMFTTGQPMHAFDTDKLDGKTISVRLAKNGEKMVTLDGKDVDLDEQCLLIADSESPLALAGIKGGNKAEVVIGTKNIVLESANFTPVEIRKTSRRIGIETDSSKRYENDITPELAEGAMNLATEMILKYASHDSTKVSNIVDHYPRKWRPYRTGVSLSEINSLLGVSFDEKQVSKAFDLLGFEYELIEPRKRVVEEAKKLIGKPYVYGASVFFDAPNSFDCSSFVSYIYSLAGFSIPRISIDQYVFSEQIDEKDLQIGDLVFSNTGITKRKIHTETVEFLAGTKVDHGIDHIGIYVGDGKIIHAIEYGDSVIIEEPLDSSERFQNTIGHGRILDDEKRFAVKAPIERLDLKMAEDLIEEVGRIVGYDKVEDTAIDISGFEPKINKKYLLGHLIRSVLVPLGFSEIISYTFVAEGELSPEKPLAQDRGYLRSTLITGVEEALEKNLNNADLLGLDHVRVFEIGKVFDMKGERSMLSLGVVNKNGVKKPKAEEILSEAVKELEGISKKFSVVVNGEVIEINLDELVDSVDGKEYPLLPPIDENAKYVPFSAYPFVLRDIAVWVPGAVKEDDVLNVIESEAGELLVNKKLFDVFEKDGRISYAFRLVFQSPDETLTDEKVNVIMDKITKVMNEEKKWEVR